MEEVQKQWQTPEQEELRRRIESHPLLALPAAERAGRTQARLELVELVMRLKKFDAKLRARLQTDRSALLMDEEEIRDARTLRMDRLARKFDSITFLTCMDKALAGYDAGQGTPFLAYFDRIYTNAMHRTANRQDALTGQERVALTRREGHLLKEMRRLSEAMGYDLKNLPPRYDRELGEALGLAPEKLRALLDKAQAASRFVSMDDRGDEEDGSVLQIADPHSEDAQARLESMAEVLRAVRMFADLDCQEYPRLFFTNDVLRPLKEEDPAVSPDVYCRVLQRMEDILWDQIFVQGYIEFTFLPPPALDRLANLLAARLGRPLQDASIAAYKQVSAAAVSYQRKRYTKAQKNWFRENGFAD